MPTRRRRPDAGRTRPRTAAARPGRSTSPGTNRSPGSIRKTSPARQNTARRRTTPGCRRAPGRPSPPSPTDAAVVAGLQTYSSGFASRATAIQSPTANAPATASSTQHGRGHGRDARSVPAPATAWTTLSPVGVDVRARFDRLGERFRPLGWALRVQDRYTAINGRALANSITLDGFLARCSRSSSSPRPWSASCRPTTTTSPIAS